MGTLRVVPHPDKEKRMYLTKEDRMSENGTLRRKGTRMYRLLVKGTPEELDRFKTGMGQYYLEEGDGDYIGQPIMNTQEQITEPRAIHFTREGRPFIEEDQTLVNLQGALKKASRLGLGVVNHMEKGIADILLAGIQTPQVTSTGSSSRGDSAPATPTQEKIGDVIDENANVKTDAPVTKLEEELDEQ